ncbi:MAG TPA: tripartite tricarboxylate transporter substrate-binding protein [Burkholderiales bacterium]|nr:tripartite tricarboxylate transporter substrate-binding protein [Burkholderiales bacterium]
MTPMRKIAALALLAWSAGAAAQAYPAKPILMLVPLQAASAVDNAARLVAQKMSDNMGQPIVVENQPGAAGLIGAERVAKAAPDGYTIGGFNDSIMTMLPNMHAKLAWDIQRDFVPVSLVSTMEWALVVPPGSNLHSAADLIAAAKARPGALNFSSGGNGSPQHIAMEMFKARAGIFVTHIPYRGATAAALDVATGQVDVHFSGMPTVYTLIKGGKLKLIGVASPARSALFPEVPTIAESGLPGFEFRSFFAITAPAGTPRDIVARLNAEVARACADAAVRDRLVAQGFSVVASPPEELARVTREQLERYARLFKQAGITAE